MTNSVPFRELVTYVVGGGWGDDLPSEERAVKVKVIRGADFPDVRVQDPQKLPLRYESERIASTRRLQSGDLVLEISGGTKDRPTGRTVFVTDSLIDCDVPTIPASFCRLIRPDVTYVDPRFLFYILQDWWNRGGSWEYQNTSTGISNFQYPVFADSFWVDLPERESQVAVASLLGALDDKIAANRYVADRCDLLRSELWQGAILAGARLEALSTVARFVNGRAFTKDATGTGRVVVRIAELNSGIGSSTVYNDIEVADDNTVRPGDLLMAWSGSLVTRRWFRDEAIVNQHIFKVISDQGYPHWAVACAVESQMPYFRSLAADKATTMGHIQRHHLDDPVAWPETINAELNALGEMLWQRALAAETESERLARTRDELLPLLMDGRISVRQAADTAARVL